MTPLLSLHFLKIWLATLIIFITLDLVWLSRLAAKLYLNQLGFLAKISNQAIVFNLPVGLLVQAIIATGLAVFIYLQLNHQPQLSTSLLTGAFLGFVIYATYDLTNYSFIHNWPLNITIIDILWGTFQGTLAGIYIYYLYQHL